MPRSPLQESEAAFFRGLNVFVEPFVMVGGASPGFLPTGLVVLETRGRKSGQPRRTPLAAAAIEGHVIVGTYRGSRSEWLKNVVAGPCVRYWLGGTEHSGRAFVVSADSTARAPADLPELVRALVDGPLRVATAFGWAFAIIQPA